MLKSLNYFFHKHPDISFFSLAFIFGLLIYSNVLHGKFVYDDLTSISENKYLRIIDLNQLWKLKPSRFITNLTFALNYKIGRLDTFGYHLTNILIHIGNSFLVYMLIKLLLKKTEKKGEGIQIVPIIAALLFLSHPVETQAVSYITQRLASLAALFFLVSIIFFIKSLNIRSNINLKNYNWLIYYFGSVLAATCAYLTKENTFVLPIVLILTLVYFFREKINIRTSIFIILPFIFIAVYIRNLFNTTIMLPSWNGLVDNPSHVAPLQKDYLLTQGNVVVTYMRLLILPVNQNLDYDFPVSRHLSGGYTWMSFLLIIFLLLFAAFEFKKFKLISFGILFFFVTLFIESYFVLEDVISEHRLYLPSVGFFIILVFFISVYYQKVSKLKFKKFLYFLPFVVIFLSGFLTFQRNKVWKDEYTLWSDVVTKSPKKSRGQVNLGIAYKIRGDLPNAIYHLQNAIKYNPKNMNAYLNLSNIYKLQNNSSQVTGTYQKALENDPSNAVIIYELAKWYADQGANERGLDIFQSVLNLKPHDPSTYFAQGEFFIKLHNYDDAIKALTKSIEFSPDYLEARNSLAHIYFLNKNYDKAIELFNKNLAINPYYDLSLLDLGKIYLLKQKYPESLAALQKYIKVDPDSSDAYYHLAAASYLMKNSTGAIDFLNESLRLDPNNIQARKFRESIDTGLSL